MEIPRCIFLLPWCWIVLKISLEIVPGSLSMPFTASRNRDNDHEARGRGEKPRVY